MEQHDWNRRDSDTGGAKMKYIVVSTSDWHQSDITPYFKDLEMAFKKISAKFPDDITPEFIVRGILSGVTMLWLVLDEDDKFIAFVTTELEVSLNGVKRVCIRHLAGKEAEIDHLVEDVLSAIEDYANSISADELTICGRLGWKRELKKHGYEVSYARYGRKLNHG